MYMKDNVPVGAPEDARLDCNAADTATGSDLSAVNLVSNSDESNSSASQDVDGQLAVKSSVLSATSHILHEIDRDDCQSFYRRIETIKNLDDRAFILRVVGLKPYDERSRKLVESVAGEGLTGALVQNLLQAPQPVPEPIKKPKRRSRPPKLAPGRLSESLIEILLREDEKAA